MKKFLFLLILAGSLLPQAAAAHFLSTDGNIGAVLHIDPDDDPIINQNATFFFDITDKQGKFQFANCQCTVTVSESGQQLTSQPISSPNFSFIFPKKDVYRVSLIGAPNIAQSFQPFTIVWNLRVDRDQTSTTSSNSFLLFLGSHVIHLVLILAGSVIVIYQVNQQKKEERKKK